MPTPLPAPLRSATAAPTAYIAAKARTIWARRKADVSAKDVPSAVVTEL